MRRRQRVTPAAAGPPVGSCPVGSCPVESAAELAVCQHSQVGQSAVPGAVDGHEAGSMAIELAVLTIPLVVLLLLVVALGRVSEARSSVDEAARDAARAASIARSAPVAGEQGRQAALADLAADGISCQAPTVTIDAGDLRPGGRVSATVSCSVSFGDLVLLRLPGSRTVSSTAVEIVDVYRGS
jgi:Flp pilus assembly protein TadG